MRLLLLLAGCLLVGCFHPVDADARRVSSCKGSCPFGECNDHCPSSQPCSSYQGDFTLGTALAACAQASGSYCLATLGPDGSRRVWGVVCADGGQTATDCTADGGTYPAKCRITCDGKTYCLR